MRLSQPGELIPSIVGTAAKSPSPSKVIVVHCCPFSVVLMKAFPAGPAGAAAAGVAARRWGAEASLTVLIVGGSCACALSGYNAQGHPNTKRRNVPGFEGIGSMAAPA